MEVGGSYNGDVKRIGPKGETIIDTQSQYSMRTGADSQAVSAGHPFYPGGGGASQTNLQQSKKEAIAEEWGFSNPGTV